MLDLSGNILAYIFCGPVPSKSVRIAKCTFKLSEFVPKAQQLFLKNESGSNLESLPKQIKRVMKRHPIVFNSFSVLCEEIITKILTHK